MEPDDDPGRVPGMDLTLPALPPDVSAPPPRAGSFRQRPGGPPVPGRTTTDRLAVSAAPDIPDDVAESDGSDLAETTAATEVTDLAAVRNFDDFYRASRTSIGRALALAIGDVDLASDATDEAMARAYERWSTVCRLDNPEAWVYRVGMNWSVSVLRRRRRSLHRLYEPASVDGPQVPDPAVHDALGTLDVKHRSVVVCRHLFGWSVAETASALGVRQGTVKSRLHRAHSILQSRLGHLRDTEEQS